MSFFSENQQALKDFVRMSQAVGARADYVQGGGGNTSVKFPDGKMAIKASGFKLSDIQESEAYAVLDAAALDLEAYPGWLRAPVSALVLNRLAALYCDEMSYAMGHPISSRRYMGVEKY